MKLLKCKECEGRGDVYCCSGHMCTGRTICFSCNGEGKVLSSKDKKIKEKYEKLMRYK